MTTLRKNTDIETAKSSKLFKGIYLLADESFDLIYGLPERQQIAKYVDIYAPQLNIERLMDDLSILKDVEVIFSGWGCPSLTDEILDAAPKLKAVFYAAGSIRRIGNNGEIFDRGIKITSSVLANAVPVAEFCLSQIIFSLKLGWHHALKIMRDKKWMSPQDRFSVAGCYDSTVGIISFGAISKKLLELLGPYDINIMLSSGYLSEKDAFDMGVRLASVDEIFEHCDVVSLHSPAHHKGIITGEHFRMMKENATFLNTARGACVREDEMIEALKQRTDIVALLDVTDPEPPIPGSEIFDLPNIVTFPHIAGSMGPECRRMAQYAIDDFNRFRRGEPLMYEVSRQQWEYMA